jgi:hypothetical protein
MPCELSVCCLLFSAINQTFNAHYQASQPYWYTNADVHAIAYFVSAFISFDQCIVNFTLIKQVCGGLCSIKCENCLTFCYQLEETHTHQATNAKCKEAHKKCLTTHLEVPFANCLMFAASISATLITLKLILIDFKKIQDEDHIKIFQLKIKATIKQLTSLIKLFDQFTDCIDISKFH